MGVHFFLWFLGRLRVYVEMLTFQAFEDFVGSLSVSPSLSVSFCVYFSVVREENSLYMLVHGDWWGWDTRVYGCCWVQSLGGYVRVSGQVQQGHLPHPLYPSCNVSALIVGSDTLLSIYCSLGCIRACIRPLSLFGSLLSQKLYTGSSPPPRPLLD